MKFITNSFYEEKWEVNKNKLKWKNAILICIMFSVSQI